METLNPRPATPNDPDIRQIEVDLLVEGIFRQYGYDFRNYARPSLTRRIGLAMTREGVATISALQDRLMRDTECMGRLAEILSVNTTAMFRDPRFFLLLRERVIPQLRTYPTARIWLAGCSTGEEVYSLAILLREEAMSDRTQVYATDFSTRALQTAKEGIYPAHQVREYTRNYHEAGGTEDFSSYYAARYGSVVFRSHLRDRIVFSLHNLVTDASFNEFNVILCRNVMIYFDRQLQSQVFRLFHGSLAPLGFLGLGHRESLMNNENRAHYEELESGARLYRKTC